MDKIVRIARSIVRIALEKLSIGDKAKKVLNHYGADEINNGQKYVIEISDTYYLKDMGQYGDFTVELAISSYNGKVKLEMKDYNNGSWSEYEPDIRDVVFQPRDDADMAQHIDDFVKGARKTLHKLCLEIQEKHNN